MRILVTRREMIGRLGATALLLRKPSVPVAGAMPASPAANVWGGTISGYWADAKAQVAAFKGIPYGDDTRLTRFQAPRKLTARWEQPRMCTTWGPKSLQMNPDPKPNPQGAGFAAIEGQPLNFHLPPDEGSQSEDCLNLCVWTPALRHGRPEGKPRAVLVYFPGGAYSNGTVNAALFDGTRLAQTGDVVVVTVNGRLNILGFLYLAGMPGLGNEYKDSGDAGMLDLVLALEWVRDNIAGFGGDPSRVTIFGQSGGGAKCATLMAMPAAHGLFERVWTMSGQQVTAVGEKLATTRATEALTAMNVAGPATAAALHALSFEQLQAGARSNRQWMPVKDGVDLPRDPFKPDAPPLSAMVPMVLGNTKDEVLAAAAWRRADMTWAELPAELAPQINAFRGTYSVDEIIAAFRTWHPEMRPVDVYVDAVAVFRSWPGQVIEAELRAEDPASAKHTWVYQMNYPSPTAGGFAPHALDIPFVFDNVALAPGMVGESEADLKAAQPLATAMSRALVEFAKTGDPNGPGLVAWPVYDLATRKTMLFDRQVRVESDPRSRERIMMMGARYRQPGT